MSDLEADLIQLLETGDAASIDLLLKILRVTVSSIPPEAGTLPDGSLDPNLGQVHTIAMALGRILERDALRIPTPKLIELSQLPDVAYQVYCYYPPAALAEWVEHKISFAEVRKRARDAIASASGNPTLTSDGQ